MGLWLIYGCSDERGENGDGEEGSEILGDFRGCIDQIFVSKYLVDLYKDKREDQHVTFMDLEKAYYNPCREETWRVLHEYRVDGYLIKSTSSLYEGSRAYVRLDSRVENT